MKFSILIFILKTISINHYVKIGDSLFRVQKYHGALKFYLKADSLYHNNFDIKFRIGKTYNRLGEDTTGKICGKYFQLADNYLKEALKIKNDVPELHFEIARNSGELALFKGGKAKVRLSKEVKHHAQIALKLKPDYPEAMFILGMWHREVATLSPFLKTFAKIIYGGLPPAYLDSAIFYIQKAIALKPERIKYRVELAKTYLKIKEKEKAEKILKEAIKMKPLDEIDEKSLNEGKRLLKKLEK